MHKERLRELCLFSLKLRQEHNCHSQLLNKSLTQNTGIIFSKAPYGKMRGNDQNLQKRNFQPGKKLH